jgi:hypothetical protein
MLFALFWSSPGYTPNGYTVSSLLVCQDFFTPRDCPLLPLWFTESQPYRVKQHYHSYTSEAKRHRSPHEPMRPLPVGQRSGISLALTWSSRRPSDLRCRTTSRTGGGHQGTTTVLNAGFGARCCADQSPRAIKEGVNHDPETTGERACKSH